MAKKRKEKWRVRRQSCEIEALEAEMIACADDLDFERAALLRDQVAALRRGDTDVPSRTPAGAPGTRPRLKRRRRS